MAKRGRFQPESQKGHAAGQSIILEPILRLCRYINNINTRIVKNHVATLEDCAGLKEAMRLIGQLRTFAVPPGPDLPRQELKAGVEFLREFAKPEEAEKAYYDAGSYPRGRPVIRRHVAAAALEAKRADPGLKRREIVDKLCPCGGEHDRKCAERLRRDMLRLANLSKEILAKYPS